MANEKSTKKKIAILGGGLASMTAAFELTDYPDWKDHYEITIYQMGWRLGGKTSVGRGPNKRIEEMGIHILQGWYNNTFRMIQTTYKYMKYKALSKQSPFQTWEDAIVPDNATLFTEFWEKENTWSNWPLVFPTNDKIPGDGPPPPLATMLKEGLGMALEMLAGSPYRPRRTLFGRILAWLMRNIFFRKQNVQEEDWKEEARQQALKAQKHRKGSREMKYLHHAHELIGQIKEKKVTKFSNAEIATLRVAAHLMGAFMEGIEFLWRKKIKKDTQIRRIFIMLGFGHANLNGIVNDVYDEKTHTFDFSKINHLDYKEWLQKNGASPEILESAPTRFLYCGAFHNLFKGKPGKLAADMGLRSLIVSVNYRSNLVWKMKGGTGGSLTAPVYKVLKDRGVQFKFFHKVEQIKYSDTGNIESFTVGEQVRLHKDVKEYQPLIKVDVVDGKILEDWPVEPNYGQLNAEDAQKLQDNKVNLESSWANWKNIRKIPMEKGRDFDYIILGIPVMALKHICSDIVDNNTKWKEMVHNVATTPTLQVQTWLKPNLPELGMDPRKWGMEAGYEPNSVIYADLLYSWTSMSLVMPYESWPANNRPQHLSYFCGTWQLDKLAPFDDHDFPERERQRLIEYTAEWLNKNMGWLWPKGTTPEHPDGLDFNLLVDPEDPNQPSPEKKFLSQYFHLNIDPSYQYTLARPGTDQYRLAPDDSGFDNLLLTGDWTNFGFNIGHIEGTVTSGLQAGQGARKKMGLPLNKDIYGDVGL